MKKLLIAIIVLLASVNISWAACSWNGNVGTASALTVTEVQACINDASTKTGEVTINLPSGTATWTSMLTITMTSSWPHLSIIGYGTIPTGTNKGSAEQTTINGSGLQTLISFTGTSTKKFRLANIKFTGAYSGYNGVLYIQGTSKPSSGGGFRIDHNDFATTQSTNSPRVIMIAGYTYGVIDHNDYYSNQMANSVSEGGGVPANASWNRAISVGTNDAVYIEDNLAVNTHATYFNRMFCDAINGARVVLRYNDLTNYYVGGHDATTTMRGLVQYEAYNNTVRLVGSGDYSSDPRFFLRGGTHIIYSNTVLDDADPTGMWSTNPIVMQNDRSWTTTGRISPWTDHCDSTVVKICLGPLHSVQYPSSGNDTCSTDADCGGESGACQNIDGNTGGNGYPCRDQIGFSPNGNIDGQLTAYPSLFWNNTYKGNTTNPVSRNVGTSATHIQNNRDYCYHATTMPASCGGIATTYTAYTYPHPLTGGGGEEDTTDPILSAWFPTTEQVCSADPQSINLGITSVDANITTCKWDTSTAAYADLTNTFDGAAAGTANHTDSASFACGATHTIYYSCQDAIGNTTDTASYTFTLPALLDETAPVITNVTSSTQAVALVQKLSVTTSVAGSCRYCVNGVDGCASDTAWASRTAFSVTGGETTHHEVSITQAASSSATYNVICQNTQGTATSANSAITITTDAAKAITAGAGSLSITQGSGSLSVTILP